MIRYLIFVAIVMLAALTVRGMDAPQERVAQVSVEDRTAGKWIKAEADVDTYLLPLVKKWEGKRNESYQDIVGVWTICYGHTRTAGPNQVKTDAECERLLRHELLDYRARLMPAFTKDTILHRLPVTRLAAYVSLAYNAGVAAITKSTAVRRLNAGDVPGACVAITWWNRAGDRIVRGLVNRRKEDYSLCMVGVA